MSTSLISCRSSNAWGYAGSGTATDPTVIGGSKSYVTSTQLKRLGINGTIQYRPQPELTFTLDGFYSNFDDDQSKRGIELPLAFGGGFGVAPFNPATGTVQNGFATSGRFDNVRGVIRNDVFQRKADLYSFGFNADYQGDDGWNAMFDFGYSRTDRNELSLESYSGTGFNQTGAAATIGFSSGETGTVFNPSLNYGNPAAIFLTDPLGWGGGAVPQAGYSNNRIIKDELYQFRIGIEKELEGSFLRSLQVGLNYTTREKSLAPDEAFVRLPGTATQVPIPSQYLLDPTNLSYLGLGPIVSYDPRELIANGALVLEPRVTTGPNAANDVLGKSYTVNEDLMTAFAQANIETDLGGAVLTGNVGVQAINTVQKSTGFIFPASGPQRRTLGDSYWDVLPSANLSLRLDSNWVFRVAAAREIMRPRLDDTRLSIGYGIDASVPGGIISGSGGNPFLRPYRANAVDFNIEKYFGTGGVVALQLFYKDIKSYIFNGRFAFDYSAFPPTDGCCGLPQPAHDRQAGRADQHRRRRALRCGTGGDAALRHLHERARRLRGHRRCQPDRDQRSGCQWQRHSHPGVFALGGQRHRVFREMGLQHPRQRPLSFELPGRLHRLRGLPDPADRPGRDDHRCADRL